MVPGTRHRDRIFDVSNPATAELLARTPCRPPPMLTLRASRRRCFPGLAPHSSGRARPISLQAEKSPRENLDDLARVITLENGKTFAKPAPNSAAPSKTLKSLVASP